MRIAVVTGASSGMGRDFALQLDAKETYDEIWLIARRKDLLEQLAPSLRSPARILDWDLGKSGTLEEYGKLLEEVKPDISVLVNAAGFGRFAHSTEVPLSVEMAMIDVNVKALVSMVTLSLPYMKPGSSIINLGSGSSFQPVPYINIYGSTKAFVMNYSRALNVELKERGVRVLCVCPGWVRTEFFDHAVSDNGAVTYYDKIYESKDVVKLALEDLDRGKDLSVIGAGVRAQRLLIKLLPHRLVMKIWMKQQKHS